MSNRLIFGSWARRPVVKVSALVIGGIALVAGIGLATALPFATWRAEPVDAFWLALGINPRPVVLTVPPVRPLSAMAQLGRSLFHDRSLSGSGRMSCATCHDPAHAYGPAGAASVSRGGADLRTAGYRAVPSLRYLYRQPAFSIGPDASGDNDGAPGIQQQAHDALSHVRAPKTARLPRQAQRNLVPQGGLFWDGRVDTLQQQASVPLFNPVEMAAGTPAAVAMKLEQAEFADDFRRLFGPDIFQDSSQAVAEAMFAIARYQIEDPSFHPFTSKYDAWLAGKVRFTPAEIRGLVAFNDPKKGNCAACHLDQPTRDDLPPLFTDFQFEALGVPRNPAIPANRDPNYYDLGVCGPLRADMRSEGQYCGMFLTPSLRNVATRRVFFHNGEFHSLRTVLDWYANRDLQPARFYPRDVSGTVVKFNDLPARYRGNVDITDAPFDRRPNDRPALSQQDIGDIIAFLETLTDGYVASRPIPSARDGQR
jgi:cytochrome c peroxidase